MRKKILGLDLGTNSVGWALIEQDLANKYGKILGMGSRIIPMSQDILGEFDKGNSVSKTAERTRYRSVRRLRERHLLRRERLHRVLNILGFLPEHYASEIDFNKRLGKFKEEKEPKFVYKPIWNESKHKNDFEFIFKKSFEEMLADFQKHQPQLLKNEKGKSLLIPFDWTLYYLRKKALTQKIKKEELGWILLNFNQKRGYYQLRGEENEENPNKLVEYHSLKIVEVTADEKPNSKGETWYSLVLENGWVYRRSSKIVLFDWKDKIRDFIVTTDLNEDGSIKTDKEGNEKRSFRAPGEDDWTLLKKKTEREISKSKKTVGAYIYDVLLQNPKQKIKGKLVRTIERKFYKGELKDILQKQKEFHRELQSHDLYNDCIRELYRTNDGHSLLLSEKDFVHLFLNDIIFYQRPLRSPKSNISNCNLEYRQYKDKEGRTQTQYLKATPKSNPYYQEFRIWQWIYNLSVYETENDANVTFEFLKDKDDFEKLFEFLDTRKEIEQQSLIKHLLEQKGLKGKLLNAEAEKYRWNYVEDKKYPCNETKSLINTRLGQVEEIENNFLTREIEQQLWHVIYSVTDKIEYEKALKSFAGKYQLDTNSFVGRFKKFPPFKSEYGSFSEKAIKKLLPLMRLGKYWDETIIINNNNSYEKNINHLLEKQNKNFQSISEKDKSEWNKFINEKLSKELNEFLEGDVGSFQGLRLHIAQYIVYGRHSEAAVSGKWNSVSDLEEYLKDFKQHSLRNPIVEQVITETLRVVKDIWNKYGNGEMDFFNEIHIELGREMKNTKHERERLSKVIAENENTNLRIKALLAEMMQDAKVENVRPYSPMQQEILKIYEEGVLNSNLQIDDDILEISKSAQPSPSDLNRYKLWLEQKYRSPYTGEIISLNKLFTSEYEIEHIIPQSCYFDESFNNKVICEAAVNKLKDNNIGFAFIKNFHGTIVECGFGKKLKIFEVSEYENFIEQQYAKNPSKRNKLLMEDIPEKMIDRQMNNTRYISKFISGLLSNIVRAEINDDGVNSKNIISVNGKITNKLKRDWGLNDAWNDLILPRFERMNQLSNSEVFTTWNENHQKFLPTVPLELSKGFSKKRIDHRHHAVDALVIACATRDHTNLLNNQSAKSDLKRYDLQNKLRNKQSYFNQKENRKKDAFKEFIKPWDSFTTDARNALENIIVSFKQNLRVVNKANNHYEKWIVKDGIKQKESLVQKGTNWAVRKPMHKETVYGKIDLKWIKVPNGKLLTATRKSLDTSFGLKEIASITDTGIQAILKNYLASKGNNSDLAFSPEGIENLNNNIRQYNNGRNHQPIYKVRVFELGSKFPVGQSGNKKDKYVEAAMGTNLFFTIYQDAKGKKNYKAIPLNIVIERQKQGLTIVPQKDKNENSLLFYLSPNDLVYVPTVEEIENADQIDFDHLTKKQKMRLYNVNDFSSTCYFTPNRFAKAIAAKEVDLNFDETNNKITGSFDTKTASLEGVQIKDVCIKLKVDRLGSVSKA